MAAKRKPTKSTPKKRSQPDWAPKFLKILAGNGNITASAKAAGIDRTTFYVRRDADPLFAAAASDALEQATDDLELEARRRAKDGTERPVFHQGIRCGEIQEYSDTLLIFLLKAHRPEKYRERYEHEHKGRVKLAVTAEDLTDDELAAIIIAGR